MISVVGSGSGVFLNFGGKVSSSMDRFKDGDRVSVVTSSSRRAGEKGIIKAQSQGYAESYWVAFIDGTVDLYKANSLEPTLADQTFPSSG